jgi:hypothetical protein
LLDHGRWQSASNYFLSHNPWAPLLFPAKQTILADAALSNMWETLPF